MKKEISLPIMVGAIGAVVLVIAVVGWMVFGGGSGVNSSQPVMTKAQKEAREK